MGPAVWLQSNFRMGVVAVLPPAPRTTASRTRAGGGESAWIRATGGDSAGETRSSTTKSRTDLEALEPPSDVFTLTLKVAVPGAVGVNQCRSAVLGNAARGTMLFRSAFSCHSNWRELLAG